MKFAAIDFETASYSRDSACSIGVVMAEGQYISQEMDRLIRPPSPRFTFTYIHGISWRDVSASPTFEGVWPEIAEVLAGVDFLAAHNAPFDRSVLKACCQKWELPPPAQPFLCTLSLSRKLWALDNHRLPTVSQHLKIPLPNHHDALGDARACARIVLSALSHPEGKKVLKSMLSSL